MTNDSESIFQFADDLGPSKIIHIYEPTTQLKAIVVVDNTACGPAVGGVRMATDVTTEEVFRLARAMTLKNAAAELPHGGGKSAILTDPKLRFVMRKAPKYETQNLLVLCLIRLLSGGYKRMTERHLLQVGRAAQRSGSFIRSCYFAEFSAICYANMAA